MPPVAEPEPRLAVSDEGPTVPITPTRVLVVSVLIVLVLIGLYLLVPKLAGLQQTWGQLRHGDPLWLAGGGALELLSIAGYAMLFRTVFGRGVPRIDWRVSLQIPLAGIAAIRLVAAAGAGGLAVTAWALGRAGMSAQVIACRLVASLVVQYSVYFAALIVFGLGLWTGVLGGGGSFALTIVPAAFAAVLAAAVLSLALMPRDVEQRFERFAKQPGALGWIAKRVAKAPDTLGSGVRTAGDLVRQRRLGLLGAVAYWGFDIAVLGFCFHAFGRVVPLAVLVVAYFLGTLGSLLPLPGGVGGVEGGMIAAFVAFGVPASSAVIAVLAYRAISFWLPTLPGIAGYLALRSTVRRWRAADAERVGGRLRRERSADPIG
ncbi:MAG: lysylphosphatidylglycerol synthase transmembrane domain-containing protein [Solirubrobacteraceae bacterium]